MASKPPPPTGVVSAAVQAVLARRGVLAAIAVIAAVAALAELARRVASPTLAELPQYRVTAASVELTPPPAWVRTDVKLEAFRNAGLHGDTSTKPLSILDEPERLEHRIATALRFHPWVRSVGTLERRPPNRVLVAVEYRRPLATIRSSGGVAPLVVDEQYVVLPRAELKPHELAPLPRIDGSGLLRDGGVQPRVGEAWNDPRIAGAVSIIASLGDAWAALRLLDITPSRTPEVRRDRPYYVYELRSTAGTRIAWGAAPDFAPADEPPFAEKLTRLQKYVAMNGPLDSVATTPAWIDVRRTLTTRPRVAEKRDSTQTAAKPDSESSAVR